MDSICNTVRNLNRSMRQSLGASGCWVFVGRSGPGLGESYSILLNRIFLTYYFQDFKFLFFQICPTKIMNTECAKSAKFMHPLKLFHKSSLPASSQLYKNANKKGHEALFANIKPLGTHYTRRPGNVAVAKMNCENVPCPRPTAGARSGLHLPGVSWYQSNYRRWSFRLRAAIGDCTSCVEGLEPILGEPTSVISIYEPPHIEQEASLCVRWKCFQHSFFLS